MSRPLPMGYSKLTQRLAVMTYRWVRQPGLTRPSTLKQGPMHHHHQLTQEASQASQQQQMEAMVSKVMMLAV